MKFLVTYTSDLVLSTATKGTKELNTLKTFIYADTVEEAQRKCRVNYGEPVSIVECN